MLGIALWGKINDKSDSYTTNNCLLILRLSYNQMNFVFKNMTFEQKDGSHFKTMAKQM